MGFLKPFDHPTSSSDGEYWQHNPQQQLQRQIKKEKKLWSPTASKGCETGVCSFTHTLLGAFPSVIINNCDSGKKGKL